MTDVYALNRTMHGLVAAPWIRSPNVTAYWSVRTSQVNIFSGNENGGDVNIITGNIPIGLANGTVKSQLNFGGTGRSVHFLEHVIGSSAVFEENTQGALQAGVAKPLSWMFVFKLPQAPNNAGSNQAQWVLGSFSSITTQTPFIAFIGTRGSTTCQWQRRNDAGGVPAAGGNLVLGTGRNVLLGIYTGGVTPTVTTILNDVVVDNAVAVNGGALTVNRFNIGGFISSSSGLNSDLEWTDIVVGAGKIWTATEIQEFKDYARRKIGP